MNYERYHNSGSTPTACFNIENIELIKEFGYSKVPMQLIKLILVFLLLIAPFEVLFANPHMAAAPEDAMSMHAEHCLATADDCHHANMQNDCEKQCEHCIFCSVAVIYPSLFK